jgi:hypothetical protein
LPEDVPLADVVNLAKLRWRIVRDYQELKQEIGSVTTKAEAGEASIITLEFRLVLEPLSTSR